MPGKYSSNYRQSVQPQLTRNSPEPGISAYSGPGIAGTPTRLIYWNRRGFSRDSDVLGHADLAHTAVYLQVSQKHLQAAPNPLDAFRFPVQRTPPVAEGFKPE